MGYADWQRAEPWNSLEVAKLISGLITPAVVAYLGVYIHRVTKRFENHQWVSQKLIEKRLDVYDDIAPLMNDLLCYFTYVGCWKELDPPDVVKLKRNLDKKVYLAAPLFPKSFFVACQRFENACFMTFGGWGQDAQLRTSTVRREAAHQKDWKVEWAKHFCTEQTDPKEIQLLYRAVMTEFASSFGDLNFMSSVTSSRIPANIE
jgi:hypothetical protein